MSLIKSISAVVHEFAARYKPEVASNYVGIVHIILTGAEPYSCTLEFSKSGCTVTDGLKGQPGCQIKTKSDSFRRIVSNKSSAQKEFIMGNIYVSNVQVISLIAKSFR